MTASRRHASFTIGLMTLGAGLLLGASVAAAPAKKASHKDWPKIDGKVDIHKLDEETPMQGRANKHNELLGGHGSDTITAGNIGDVLWGDYKPSGQPPTQKDVITGGTGKDHIYASHGTNIIVTRGGADQVHAHFGCGTITCTNRKPLIFLSHRSQKRYKLHGCTRITFRSSL
jgi:Ca2+-binding RTX toxin-like protein